MLTEQEIHTIKATIPVLEEAGDAITQHFYKRLFTHQPELQHIFNLSHQHQGQQPTALFQAILGYAKNIENVAALKAVVNRIANKHTSLNIQAEHYPIVGHHLIETLRELLGEAFTPDIEHAWLNAYQALAQVFIDTERNIYDQNKFFTGGWTGERTFIVAERKRESELVTSFVLKPKDNGSLMAFKPGQYLGIKVNIPGHEWQEIRQYSLSCPPNREYYRISVKRETGSEPGIVSHYLHDHIEIGTEVEIYAPAGDFYFVNRHRPVVLMSAGVGLTPMQSMLEYLSDIQYEPPIYYLHACKTPAQHSFKSRVEVLQNTFGVKAYTWYESSEEKPSQIQHEENIKFGGMELEHLSQDLPKKDGDFYLCGPIGFMASMKKQLLNLGVSSERIYYEVFGPHQSLV